MSTATRGHKLTPDQRETLVALIAEDPLRPYPQIARHFEAATGRAVTPATVWHAHRSGYKERPAPNHLLPPERDALAALLRDPRHSRSSNGEVARLFAAATGRAISLSGVRKVRIRLGVPGRLPGDRQTPRKEVP